MALRIKYIARLIVYTHHFKPLHKECIRKTTTSECIVILLVSVCISVT